MITWSLPPLSGIQNAKTGFRQLDLRHEAGDLQRASAGAVWLPWREAAGGLACSKTAACEGASGQQRREREPA
jgi:hypothetical protein